MTPTQAPRPLTGSASRSRRSRRAAGAAASVAVLALLTAACGNGSTSADDSGSAKDSGSSSTAKHSTGTDEPDANKTDETDSSSDGSGSGEASASPGDSTDVKAAPADGTGSAAGSVSSDRCTAEHLGMKLGRPDPGAGNVYFTLTFTNKGANSCTLNGYPGVSLLRKDGSIIGKPADRSGSRGGAVKLAAGKSAVVALHTLNEGMKGSGCWREPALLKVYPPGSKDSLTLRASNPRVCGDTFDVTTVQTPS